MRGTAWVVSDSVRGGEVSILVEYIIVTFAAKGIGKQIELILVAALLAFWIRALMVT